ncbi:hypothetical protein JXA88_04255 [Candidatus Fermentibacteria bacterium]|nr:hypothetical protein [Candidatus Fermentibacteria bacterium]
MAVRAVAGTLALLVVVTEAHVPIGDLHRNDAQGLPAEPYGVGAQVQIGGIVTVPTGVFSAIRTEIYVEDATGGILVYRSDHTHQVVLGDSVVVHGTIDQYFGTTRIVPSNVAIAGHAGSPSEPRMLTCAAIADAFHPDFSEPDESRLVRVVFAWYDAASGIITDTSGSCTLHIDTDTGISLQTGLYDITGVVRQWDLTLPYVDSYELVPRFSSDIQAVAGPQFITDPIEGSFTPTGFTVEWSTDVPAGAGVLYGVLNPGDLGFVTDSTMALSHTLLVHGLEPATIYRLQAVIWNAEGENRSPVWSASTSSAPDCTGGITAFFTQSVEHQYATMEQANGDALLERRLLDRINGAAFSIDACLYNLTVSEITNALIVAKNRGVRVRVIAEAENIGTEMLRLMAAGIPVLADTAGVNDGAAYMHNKFLVFDFADRSSAADDFVWTGSANVTYNGFYHNAENVVLVQDQALAGAYTAEFEEMWGSSGPLPEPTEARFGARKRDNTPHRFLIGAHPAELYMSPSDGCVTHLVEAIGEATRGLYFSIFGFTNEAVDEALHAARDYHGVRVAGVFDAGQATSSSRYWPMSGVGGNAWNPPADVHLLGSYPSMHHKYLLIDADNSAYDAAVITGSYNWSYSAEGSNDENTLVIHDPRVANLFLQEFMARYHESGGCDTLALDAAVWPQTRTLELVVGPCPWLGSPRLTISAPGIQEAAIYDLSGRVLGRAASRMPAASLRLYVPSLPAGAFVITGSGPWGTRSQRIVYTGP